jgi:hypothetical protein
MKVRQSVESSAEDALASSCIRMSSYRSMYLTGQYSNAFALASATA